MSALPLALLLASVGVTDTDGDGVPDSADAYPCDATASAQVFAPGAGQHAMLMFEDRWPARGDLDFNDAVIAWTVALRANAAGQVVALRYDLDVLALGGILDHGLALRLPVPRASLASATRRIDGGAPQPLAPTADDQVTVRISDNLRELFGDTPGQLNSTSADVRRQGQQVIVDVRFTQPVTLAASAAPYDLFIFRSGAVGHEIHRPIYGGTASMDAALFGTEDDGSTGTRRFVDRSGLPFALAIPQVVAYPAEGVEIAQLYPRIVSFAASGGTSDTDFYLSGVPAAAFADANGNGVLAPRFYGDRVPDACNECPSGQCLAPSCTDGVQNGLERQVDCGGACAIPEACNGVDDDCDGEIDQGNPGGGIACTTSALGACAAGLTTCGGGAISCATTVSPVTETCNGIDDDCDGSTDEGNACTTTDDFTVNSGLWTSEIAYGGSSFSPTWSGGLMSIVAPNNALVRTRSTNAIDGDFDIVVNGRAFWNGSNIATHIKPFVGLYHAGSTTNTALQYRCFFDNTAVFGGDTHYGVDINALIGTASGVTRTFALRFNRVGSTVRIYSISGSTETLRSTFTITSPSAALRFEMVHVDGTSSGNGTLQMDSWQLTRLF